MGRRRVRVMGVGRVVGRGTDRWGLHRRLKLLGRVRVGRGVRVRERAEDNDQERHRLNLVGLQKAWEERAR